MSESKRELVCLEYTAQEGLAPSEPRNSSCVRECSPSTRQRHLGQPPCTPSHPGPPWCFRSQSASPRGVLLHPYPPFTKKLFGLTPGKIISCWDPAEPSGATSLWAGARPCWAELHSPCIFHHCVSELRPLAQEGLQGPVAVCISVQVAYLCGGPGACQFGLGNQRNLE